MGLKHQGRKAVTTWRCPGRPLECTKVILAFRNLQVVFSWQMQCNPTAVSLHCDAGRGPAWILLWMEIPVTSPCRTWHTRLLSAGRELFASHSSAGPSWTQKAPHPRVSPSIQPVLPLEPSTFQPAASFISGLAQKP